MSSNKHATRHHSRAVPAPVSRARRQFDALASKLHAASAELEAYRQGQREALALVQDELLPLGHARHQRLKQLVLQLDQKHGKADLDDWERERLSSFLADAALDLLEQDDDPGIELVYQRHSGVDAEEEDAFHQAEFKHLVSEIYGMDIDDEIDLRTPEGREVVHALIEKEEAVDAARRARSAAQAEEERSHHAVQLQQALDEIVCGLEEVADAGRDMDEDVRQARLELMRRVGMARAEGNLLDLLAVRFELEQHGMINRLSEKQLSECNKVLKEELRQLELEFVRHKKQMAQDLPEVPVALLTPELMLEVMTADIGERREELVQIERDLDQLQDTEKLKAWLHELGEPDVS